MSWFSLLPQIMQRLDRLETRIKLLEEESRQSGLDLSRFYSEGKQSPPDVRPPE